MSTNKQIEAVNHIQDTATTPAQNQAASKTKKTGFPSKYGEKLVDELKKYGMPWYRAGTTLWRERNGEIQFLLVHEARVKIDGVWQDGDGGWNLPCGRAHVNADQTTFESFAQAAKRETCEEIGLTNIKLGPLVYECMRTDCNNPYLIKFFAATTDEEVATASFSPTREIDQIRWLSRTEIMAISSTKMLDGKPAYLRNPTMTLAATYELIESLSRTDHVPHTDILPSKHKTK